MRKIATASTAAAHIKRPRVVAEDADNVTVAVAASEFLFTQASICASVMMEPNSYLIHPQFSHFVNNNGDTWSNTSLKANKDSWIGAYNFVNHKDGDENGVGVILDVALRINWIDPDKNLFNYYTDILIATHRDFSDLVTAIANSEIEYLSMGCDAAVITCSQCGHESYDEHDCCDHALNSKGRYFIDRAGTRRICAEVLGNEEPGSTTFVEASWLTMPPAFHGAVRRNVVPIDNEKTVKFQMPKQATQRPAFRKFLT